jgi:hypothetical protein
MGCIRRKAEEDDLMMLSVFDEIVLNIRGKAVENKQSKYALYFALYSSIEML